MTPYDTDMERTVKHENPEIVQNDVEFNDDDESENKCSDWGSMYVETVTKMNFSFLHIS